MCAFVFHTVSFLLTGHDYIMVLLRIYAVLIYKKVKTNFVSMTPTRFAICSMPVA